MMGSFLMLVRILRAEIKLLGTTPRFARIGWRRHVAVHVTGKFAAIAIYRAVALRILSRCAIAPGTAPTPASAAATRTPGALAAFALWPVKSLAIAIVVAVAVRRTLRTIGACLLNRLACRIARGLVTTWFRAPRLVPARLVTPRFIAPRFIASRTVISGLNAASAVAARLIAPRFARTALGIAWATAIVAITVAATAAAITIASATASVAALS